MAEPAKIKPTLAGVNVQEAADASSTSTPAVSAVTRSATVSSSGQIPKLVVRDLTVTFHHQRVLDNVSLQIAANRVTCIMGPAGTGKSTLLRCFNRTNDMIDGAETLGEVLLDDQNIRDPRQDVGTLRKRVAHVIQASTVFPTTIFENVAYGPRVAGTLQPSELRQAVETGLRRGGLWDELRNDLGERASQLSGGQQYRLCIARALAMQPEVLLLDEPAYALDPNVTAQVEDLIFDLKNELTIVAATNSVPQAARLSDFTAFLLQGRVVEAGLTTEVFTNPKDRRTEDYVCGRFG